jgi:GABA permease
VLPSKIFEYLLATSGAIALLVYLVIAVSQLRMRRQMDDDSELDLKMWAYPVLTWVVIAFIVFTVAFMAQREGYRLQLWLTLGLAAVIAAVGMVRQRQGALHRSASS